MATTTIYPYGTSTETPSAVILEELSGIQSILDQLAPLAFKDNITVDNPSFINVAIFPTASGAANLRLGKGDSQVSYMMSPMYKLGEVDDSVSISFSCGETASGSNLYPCLLFVSSVGEFLTYYNATSNPRTVNFTISSNTQYCRLLFPSGNLYDSYIYDNANEDYLFKGSETVMALVQTPDDFISGDFLPSDYRPNSQGDYIGWNFSTSNSAATAMQTDYFAAKYCKIGISQSTTYSYSISKIIDLPSGVSSVNIEFSCGVVNTSLVLRLLNPETKTANYYTANANPRTVTLNTSTWKQVQLYFLTTNYSSCYVKNADTNEMLWSGSN